MSNTAILVLNPRTTKYEATFNGQVIVASQDKKYVQHVIRNGLNAKAKALNITSTVDGEFSEASGAVVAAVVEPEIKFDVNERFEFLADYVDMVADGDRKSTIVVGEGGLGKSFTVMNRLAKKGMKNVADMEIGANVMYDIDRTTFVVVKGYSTAKGLFRTLYENRGRLIVFDDCDSILKDPTAANLLKAALDSYDERWVTWNAESFGESDLPKSFQFLGGVIFISNMSMAAIPQAVITRAAAVDVSMTRQEVIDRMRTIAQDENFLPNIELPLKLEAVDFIQSVVGSPQIKTLNLRTLIGVATNRRCKPANWKRLSLAEMISAR